MERLPTNVREHLEAVKRSVAWNEDEGKLTFAKAFKKMLPGSLFISSLLIGKNDLSKDIRDKLLKRMGPGSRYPVVSTTTTNGGNFDIFLTKKIMNVPGGALDKTEYIEALLDMSWTSQRLANCTYSIFSLLSPEEIQTAEDLSEKMAENIQAGVKRMKKDLRTQLAMAEEIANNMKLIKLQAKIEDILQV